MTKDAIGVALLILGVVVGRLAISGEHLAFVKQSLTIPLLLSAGLLAVLGVIALRETRTDDDEHVDHDDELVQPLADAHAGHEGHDHAGAGPRMGALLLAPVAALLLIPAVPLGAFSTESGGTNRVPEQTGFDPLPDAVDGAVELNVPELVGRAVIEPEALDGTDLRTTGFVVPDEARPGTYLLSRFTVGCCAVDAVPFQILVETNGASVPPLEQWVEAVVRFTGEVADADGEDLPVFELVDQQLIDEPDVPYVY